MDSMEFGEDVGGDKLEKLKVALYRVSCMHRNLQRCAV